jgi:acetyl-CoA acetyltransferase
MAPSASAPEIVPLHRESFGTALDELERTGKGAALIAMCIAGGEGIATVIERV